MTRYHDPCGCSVRCGDDGDTEGPGVCKGLPRMPEPPLMEIVLVPRSSRASDSSIVGALPDPAVGGEKPE